MVPLALITGITGQDGSYLAELLLSKGYEVHGMLRRASSVANTWRIDPIWDRLRLHHGDVTDAASCMRLVSDLQPAELYHLAAQSHVGVSFEAADYTATATGLGTLRLLEAVRACSPKTRFYQASTSELYGNQPPYQSESTPFSPRSPYAAAKLYAHTVAQQYREAYGLHVSCGILFNHESPRRGETFVTRKVCIAASRKQQVRLGNLEARRDWGWAPEYVEAMWRMLQQDQPGDYVIATGISHSVRELCQMAYGRAGLDWQEYVKEDPAKRRPLEVDYLSGNATKARKQLGWEAKIEFPEIVERMMDAELA